MRSTSSFRIFLSLVLSWSSTLLFLKAQAWPKPKDWKMGDPGDCPGTLDAHTLKCMRPYLCEPTKCYGCTDVYSSENRCVHCGGLKDPACTVANTKTPMRPRLQQPAHSRAHHPRCPTIQYTI